MEDNQANASYESSHEEEGVKSVFPFFKSWSQAYIFVLAELAALILLFYTFSNAYA
jgi:ATP/ADP translocase